MFLFYLNHVSHVIEIKTHRAQFRRKTKINFMSIYSEKFNEKFNVVVADADGDDDIRN